MKGEGIERAARGKDEKKRESSHKSTVLILALSSICNNLSFSNSKTQ